MKVRELREALAQFRDDENIIIKPGNHTQFDVEKINDERAGVVIINHDQEYENRTNREH